jgi:hypothetical protein
MNCKPGDLAVIVDGHEFRQNEGRIVRCLWFRESWKYPGQVAWKVEVQGQAPLIGWITHSSTGPVTTPFCLESELRPIRDPGDDARDQTLEWVPSKETTPCS